MATSLRFNRQGISSSERIIRHAIALSVGVVVAFVIASGVGLILPLLKWPILLALLLFWLYGAVVAFQREDRGRQAALEALARAKDYTNECLPKEFHFITRETTVQEVTEALGTHARVRGSGDIQALQYNLAGGAAVLIFPDRPFQPSSRILGIHYYADNNDIQLFP